MSKAVAKVQTYTVETPTFTVRQAREGFGDLDAAVASVAAAKAGTDRAVGHVMWNAALLAHNVLETNRGDYIGRDKPYADQGAFVAALGFGKSYGTLLKRLGRAAVVHGVKRGSAAWTFLAVNGGRAEVGKAVALDDTEAFNAEVQSMIAQVREHGKITQGSRGPNREGGSGESDKTESTDDREVPARPATIGDVMRTLDDLVKTLDRDAWADVESRLTRIIERENLNRAHAAKQARKQATSASAK